MFLKASPKSSPTEKVSQIQTQLIDGIHESTTGQDNKTLTENSNLHESKLPASRLVQISFYDPQDNLISPVKEARIEANTELHELFSTVQDILEQNIAATSCERYRSKSIKLRILSDKSYQSFPWPNSEMKGDNYELDCGGELTWDQLESMNVNWTKSREILLKNDQFLKDGYPVLVVQTKRDNQDSNFPPTPISGTDNDGCFKAKSSENPIDTETDCQKIIDDKEFNNPTKLIERSKSETEENFECKGYNRIQEQKNEEATTPIEKQKRETAEFGNLNAQVKQKETIQSTFQCQITSPSEPWIEEKNKSQTNCIFPIEHLNLSEDIKRERCRAQIAQSPGNFTPCWSDCDETTGDEILTQYKTVNNRKDPYEDFKVGRTSPKLTRDLEIYRRFHESAISYSNEDEEAFFPSTPKSIPEAYMVNKSRKTFTENHQVTQLDLDKIVKDAVVRKMNKKKYANLNPQASPVLNLNEDMFYNQQAFFGHGFNQEMNISQEQNELQQLELMYAHDSCEIGDNFFSQNSPAYFLRQSAKDHMNMFTQHTDQNLLSNFGSNAQNYMNNNVPHMNTTMVDYLNNDHNLDSFLGLPYTNPYTLETSGAYFLNSGHQFGLGDCNFDPTYILQNQINIHSPSMWNTAQSQGVF